MHTQIQRKNTRKYTIATACCLLGNAYLRVVSATGPALDANVNVISSEPDYNEIANELTNNSNIAQNLLSAFMQVHADLKEKNNLTHQLSQQIADTPAYAIGAQPQQQPVQQPIVYVTREQPNVYNDVEPEESYSRRRTSRSKPRSVLRDHEIVKNSLATLTGGFIRGDTDCRLCCSCTQKAIGNVIGSSNSGKQCNKYILDEIERVLDAHFGDQEKVDGVQKVSSLLNGLFAQQAPSEYSITDIAKRISKIPAKHQEVKMYLVVLLDSILMDLCNSYNCLVCRALYKHEGFLVYRVIRALSLHTPDAMARGTAGIRRITSTLSSTEEVGRLVNTLENVLTLTNLNSSLFDNFKNSLGNINPMRAESFSNKVSELSNILLNMLGITIVLERSTLMYRFMLHGKKTVAIPSSYNADNSNLYNMLRTTRVDPNNVLRVVRTTGENNIGLQSGFIQSLKKSGLNFLQPSDAEIRITQTIPISIAAQQIRVPAAPVHPQGVVYSSPANDNPDCQKKTKISGMAKEIASLIDTSSAVTSSSPKKGILKRSVRFENAPSTPAPTIKVSPCQKSAGHSTCASGLAAKMQPLIQQAFIPIGNDFMYSDDVSVPIVDFSQSSNTQQFVPYYAEQINGFQPAQGAPIRQQRAAPVLNPTRINPPRINNNSYGLH
ncbi:hypothetical protein NEAUS03_1091 [Nematocida ausubeli]|nr:hypothetical protein NEAUS03_1091 [Nematocida ausubeli]